MNELKKTPLDGVHQKLGAKMVGFAGHYLPVSYGSIIEEHRAVRERAGLFDVSHMGEILLSGPGAKDFVNYLITNDCADLPSGSIQYTVMCRGDGTVVDDLLVYVLEDDGDQRMLLVVNAANTGKDLAHISAHNDGGVRVKDISSDYALLAVQGPLSREILRRCPLFEPVGKDLDTVPYYQHFSFVSEGKEVMVSRTGYTGELGFEVFVPPSLSLRFWEEILGVGGDFGILPVGIAARDTLRFEASFCLYGHELDDRTSPLEAGLGWLVKLGKPRFVGKEALVEEKGRGPRRKLIGLEISGRAIARQGFPVLVNGEKKGEVTSGSFSPTLKKSLCMAFVKNEPDSPGLTYSVEVREKKLAARRRPLPFYKSRARL